MKRFSIPSVLWPAVVLIGMCGQVEAQVIVERLNYRGWDGSYRLRAGAYSLVVVPEIGGRIMEYSIGGRNVIWENPDEYGKTYPITKVWHNYGGYKTWPAPQELWGWPPDPMLDYGKTNVEILRGTGEKPLLRITSAPSLETGIVFMKDIELAPDGAVTLTQRMRNISGHPVRYSLWDVTQVKTPCFVVFPVSPDSRFEKGIRYSIEESRSSDQFTVYDGLCITEYIGKVGKIGSDSNGPWMIWFQDKLAYVKTFGPMQEGVEYPHGGCSAEVFTSDEKLGYLEMEILGPIVELNPGEETALVEEWRLYRLSQPVKDKGWIPKSINGMRGKGWIE